MTPDQVLKGKHMDGSLSMEFAEFMARSSAVKFGDFVLKSGMRSDIFINFGSLCSGFELERMGHFFARAIVEYGLDKVDALFGPAYKGINIAIATSIALSRYYKIDLPISYNRKTFKDHGEGGQFVGHDLARARSVLVVDDVITDGLTKYESIAMLSQFPSLKIRAFLIGVDREDIDSSGILWRKKFEEDTDIEVRPITTKGQVLQFK